MALPAASLDTSINPRTPLSVDQNRQPSPPAGPPGSHSGATVPQKRSADDSVDDVEMRPLKKSEPGACYHCQLNRRNCTRLPIPPSRVDRCDDCYGKMDKKGGCCMTRPQCGMCMMAGAACTWVVSDMSIARRTEIDRIREALEREVCGLSEGDTQPLPVRWSKKRKLAAEAQSPGVPSDTMTVEQALDDTATASKRRRQGSLNMTEADGDTIPQPTATADAERPAQHSRCAYKTASECVMHKVKTATADDKLFIKLFT